MHQAMLTFSHHSNLATQQLGSRAILAGLALTACPAAYPMAAYPIGFGGPDAHPQALQELLETARASMRVPYRPDGPRMAYYFDCRPQLTREEGGTKRKLVVDNYEVEPQPDGGFQAKRRPVFQRAVQVGLGSTGARAFEGSGCAMASWAMNMPCRGYSRPLSPCE